MTCVYNDFHHCVYNDFHHLTTTKPAKIINNKFIEC